MPRRADTRVVGVRQPAIHMGIPRRPGTSLAFQVWPKAENATAGIACKSVAKCYHRAMSQPVKISDELILDARLTAEIADRSIAGQIEFWAQLGRALEPLLEGSAHLLYVGPARRSRCRSAWPRWTRPRVTGASWNTSTPGRFPTISPFPDPRACWFGSMAMAREPWADSSVGNSRQSHELDGVRRVGTCVIARNRSRNGFDHSSLEGDPAEKKSSPSPESIPRPGIRSGKWILA